MYQGCFRGVNYLPETSATRSTAKDLDRPTSSILSSSSYSFLLTCCYSSFFLIFLYFHFSFFIYGFLVILASGLSTKFSWPPPTGFMSA